MNSEQPESTTKSPPSAIGRYRILSVIGEGGMGVVYKGIGADGAPVAVKLVKEKLATDPQFRRRFDREARFAAGVKHPHVVPVLDTGLHDGVPYIVQRFIGGSSLEQKIEREGPLDLETLLAVCTQTADGLDAIHAVGVTHRDLKPGNVLIDEEGSVHITDFGLAKQRDASMLTMPGQVLGSMDYMAPEQIRGEEVGPATDLYALGCVMFVCASGEPPFADKQGMKILYAHLQDEPPNPLAKRPDLPAALGDAILQALAKEPSQRPANATEYARILQAASGGG